MIPVEILLTIVQNVADEEGTEVAELPPLYDTIDPDTLRAFVDSSLGESTTVEFSYCGCDVTISGGGNVAVSNIKSGNTQRL